MDGWLAEGGSWGSARIYSPTTQDADATEDTSCGGED